MGLCFKLILVHWYIRVRVLVHVFISHVCDGRCTAGCPCRPRKWVPIMRRTTFRTCASSASARRRRTRRTWTARSMARTRRTTRTLLAGRGWTARSSTQPTWLWPAYALLDVLPLCSSVCYNVPVAFTISAGCRTGKTWRSSSCSRSWCTCRRTRSGAWPSRTWISPTTCSRSSSSSSWTRRATWSSSWTACSTWTPIRTRSTRACRRRCWAVRALPRRAATGSPTPPSSFSSLNESAREEKQTRITNPNTIEPTAAAVPRRPRPLGVRAAALHRLDRLTGYASSQSARSIIDTSSLRSFRDHASLFPPPPDSEFLLIELSFTQSTHVHHTEYSSSHLSTLYTVEYVEQTLISCYYLNIRNTLANFLVWKCEMLSKITLLTSSCLYYVLTFQFMSFRYCFTFI